MASQETTDLGSVETPTQVVVGLFKNEYEAHAAVSDLKANGFSTSEIGAAFRTRPAGLPSGMHSERTLHQEHGSWWDKVKDAFRTDDSVERDAVATREDYSPAGTSASASDDYEYDLANHEFQGSLVGAGISDARAAYLTRNLEPGGAIITVRSGARALDAEEILAANNARVRYEDVENEYPEQPSSILNPGSNSLPSADAGYTRDQEFENAETTVDRGAGSGLPTGSALESHPAGDRIQLFGEVLRVHKDRIQRGEVRIHKDVVTENQTIEVPVTREELVLEQVPVSGTTPASSGNIGRQQEIRVPLTEEKVRLEKQEIVREEVLVGKREVSETASVGDAVKHEELRVDSDIAVPKRTVTPDETAEDLRRRG